MAKEFYIRVVTAGRYRKAVRYRRTLPGDSAAVRARKAAVTGKAQAFINGRNSTERLAMLLCANFDRVGACFVTLTFDNAHLPASQEKTKQAVAAFMRALRKEWKLHGRELKYIYVIEGESLMADSGANTVGGDPWEVSPWRDKERWAAVSLTPKQHPQDQRKRFHVHAFLVLEKRDYETVKAFWRHGSAYINRINSADPDTFFRLASYVTKEQRNGGKSVGARSYVPSLNLEKPSVEGRWCSEVETIEPPRGAEVICAGREDTLYTSYSYCFYRLPRPHQPPQLYHRTAHLWARS